MKKYHSFSITCKGAKHEKDVPCQDTSTHYPDNPGNIAIAVIADGHGSKRCFRSDIGSKIAVEITKNIIIALVNKTQEFISEMSILITLNNVVREIINKWFAAVIKDEEAHPLIDDQRLERVIQRYKERYINDVDYRCHVYGTTLLVTVMCENYWFGFQIGDGKCAVLYEDGSWDLPIPWDDKCEFNTTTSICDDNSLSSFRYWFGFNNTKESYVEYGYGVNGQEKDYVREILYRPIAIFIGSDGLDDSYPRVDNNKYIINFYRNRIVSLYEGGYDAFNEEIDGLVKRFANRESTDDVSIAGIIGDIRKVDISKMKKDSNIHEIGVAASEKRRDADEKKHVYEMIKKKIDIIKKNQKQLEEKITSFQSDELEKFKTKIEKQTNICDQIWADWEKVEEEAQALERLFGETIKE
jgi:hypothetical protein